MVAPIQLKELKEGRGNWWAIGLRAAAAILLGIIALARPVVTVAALIILFGVYAMADGLFAIVAAVRGIRANERWGWLLFEGIVGVVIGAIALLNPAIGALALTWLVAGWALVTGMLEVAAGLKLRKVMTGEWLLFAAGIVSILFALLIAFRPAVGLVALVTWVGIYALLYGAMTLVLAFRVRKWTHTHP